MIKSFNGLRFLFALMICCGHFIFTTPNAGAMTGMSAFFDTTAAVTFFFILSGFSLSFGFSQKMIDGTFKPVEFLRKRFWKLYPMHIFALIIILLLFGRSYNWNAETIRNFIFNIFLLQSYVPDMNCYFAFNRVSWYLSSLVFIYVVFALFFKYIYKDQHSMWLLAILSGLWSVALVLFAHFQKSYDDFVFGVFPPTRLLQFFVGAWLFLFYKELKKIDFNKITLTCAEFFSIICLCLSWSIRNRIPDKYESIFLYIPACALIILVFALSDGKGLFAKIMGSKVMIFLGSISYAIYMLHLFSQNLACGIVSQNFYEQTPFLFFAFYLLFVIVFASIMDFLLVKKFAMFMIKRNKNNE